MLSFLVSAIVVNALTYEIVGTGTTDFYSDAAVITEPQAGEAYYGQDAHYQKNMPSYTDNGDGTVTDNITDLMWQQDMGEKISWHTAFTKADTLSLGGYDDWRFPTIKELYSLIDYNGHSGGETAIIKFIDTVNFNQPIGNTSLGEREIDAQTWSATKYVGLTMNKDSTIFGVNFIDGRIKGYPQYDPMGGSENTMYSRMVRGGDGYGKNMYKDNGDGTITDSATGLMWQTADDGIKKDWEGSLSYAENLEFASCSDWRLPSVKELQSIVDYSRAPSITNSAAIDPLFACTEIDDPDGNSGHYGIYWSATTHLDGNVPESNGCYVAFGEAQGKMTTPQGTNLMDVHGAGAQRSDPKSGDSTSYPEYFGPQGDVRYVYNFVRCVRYADLTPTSIEVRINSNTDQFDLSSRIIGNELKLSFNLPKTQNVTVDLLSANGRSVMNIFSGMMSTGNNIKSIKLSNKLSQGLYLVSVEGVDVSAVSKLIVQ
jgi:hypothetical protein